MDYKILLSRRDFLKISAVGASSLGNMSALAHSLGDSDSQVRHHVCSVHTTLGAQTLTHTPSQYTDALWFASSGAPLEILPPVETLTEYIYVRDSLLHSHFVLTDPKPMVARGWLNLSECNVTTPHHIFSFFREHVPFLNPADLQPVALASQTYRPIRATVQGNIDKDNFQISKEFQLEIGLRLGFFFPMGGFGMLGETATNAEASHFFSRPFTYSAHTAQHRFTCLGQGKVRLSTEGEVLAAENPAPLPLSTGSAVSIEPKRKPKTTINPIQTTSAHVLPVKFSAPEVGSLLFGGSDTHLPFAYAEHGDLQFYC